MGGGGLGYGLSEALRTAQLVVGLEVKEELGDGKWGGEEDEEDKGVGNRKDGSEGKYYTYQ